MGLFGEREGYFFWSFDGLKCGDVIVEPKWKRLFLPRLVYVNLVCNLIFFSYNIIMEFIRDLVWIFFNNTRVHDLIKTP